MMRYIIDLLRNSSEPDKIVHRKAAFIEVITRVFTAHIENDRKPFEQYYPCGAGGRFGERRRSAWRPAAGGRGLVPRLPSCTQLMRGCALEGAGLPVGVYSPFGRSDITITITMDCGIPPTDPTICQPPCALRARRWGRPRA